MFLPSSSSLVVELLHILIEGRNLQSVTSLRLAICTEFSTLDFFHIGCLFHGLLHFHYAIIFKMFVE